MRGIVLRFLGSMLALWITVTLGQALGLQLWLGAGRGEPASTGTLISAALAVVVLAIVNTLIRPIIMLFTLPLSCITFGLFGIIINALLFWIVGSVVPGFHVGGFLAALFGSVVMGLISGILNQVIVSRD